MLLFAALTAYLQTYKLRKEQYFQNSSSRKTPGSDGDFFSLKLPSIEAHTCELAHKISAPYSVCWQPCLRQTYCPCSQYGCLWLFTPKPIIQVSIWEWKGTKGKAVPFQAWSGPEGSRKLTFPDFTTTAQDGSKVVNLTHRPPLPPGNTPGTHFC